MNKITFLAASLLVALNVFSAENVPFRPKDNKKIQAMGGSVMVPGSLKGHILFANMQTNVPAAELTNTVKILIGMTRLDIRFKSLPGTITPEDASTKAKEFGANSVVFIISNDKSNTTLLCAPESGWSIINAAEVTKGARNQTFAAARLRKEMIRAFFLATGAMSSQYPGSIMGYVGSPDDLDNLVEEIPVDVRMRCVDYIAKMGVCPVQYATYLRAVQQGWAPSPTNDVQKAIWEKVKAEKDQKPTNPIKVTYDPKTAPKVEK